MEKGIEFGFEHYMEKIPGMGEVDPRASSPLVLAYIGDCVFDLIIKMMVAEEETDRYTSCMRRPAIMCRRLRSPL